MQKRCPTPDKLAWDTHTGAQQMLRHIRKTIRFGARPTHVYHCECGQWHMSTKTARPSPAARERKRQRRGA